MADRRGDVQVLMNLMSNAVKFGGRGGRVSVCVHASGSACRVIVRDTGSGFSESMRAQFGEAYAQDNGVDTFPKGTGLGLAISKRMAAATGGWVRDAAKTQLAITAKRLQASSI
jgi:signal transduction histidine kinase